MPLAQLLLRGSGHDPALALDCGSSLFFRPTCAGASSSRAVTVRNTSRVPVAWRWVLSKLLQEAVAVEPQVGRVYKAAIVCSTVHLFHVCLIRARCCLLH